MSNRSSSSSSRMSQSPVATLQVAMRPLEGPSSASSSPTPSSSSSNPSDCTSTSTTTASTTHKHHQTNVSNHNTRSTIPTTSKTKNTGTNHHCHTQGISYTSTTVKNTPSKKRRLPTPTNIICPLEIDADIHTDTHTHTTTAPLSHKKRKGLVRRTHSPKNVPSPKSTPIKPLPPQRLQQPQYSKTSPSLLHTKQRQPHSPQPVHASSPPLSPPPMSPRLSVRHVAPTIKGVAEGARVVLNGNIMAIPTESTYVACTTCQTDHHHSNNTVTNATTNSKLCLELMILANVKAAATAAAIAITKANTYAPTNAASNTKPSSPTPYGIYYKRPLVLVQSVMDVGNIIPLPIKVYAVQRPSSPTPKPKSIPEHTTFQEESPAVSTTTTTTTTTPVSPSSNTKQPQVSPTPLSTTDSVTSSTSTTTASCNNDNLIKAAFSETRQVLQRLASLYWPGPIEIYVSVEQKGNLNTTGKLPKQQPPQYPKELLQPFPLPLKQRETNTRCHVYYVGFKCPSHPLTGRVLTEVANQQQQQQQQKSQLSSNTTTFVMGVDCYSTAASSYCTKATQVCDSLLRQSSSTHNHKSAYVLNGEDKREMFAVPPCQMKDTTSLYVDNFHRCIYICGTSSSKSSHTSSSMLWSCGGDADQIRKALIQNSGPAVAGTTTTSSSSEVERQRSTSGASSTSIDSLASTSSNMNHDNRASIRSQHRHRVMQAVLRKWKVIDFRS